MPTVVGYCRVSTDQQGESGAGLEWQDARISDEVARRGWDLREMYVDVASGKSTKRRPMLTRAMRDLEHGDATLLVVAKLDRLSRSMIDFAGMVQRASDEGWGIAALDIGVDTSTTNGRMLANIIMALAQWERELIGDRTKAALSAVRARGTRLGRPTVITPDARAIVRAMRRQGSSYRQIAAALDAAGEPTPQGAARWHASTVRIIHLQADAIDRALTTALPQIEA